MDPLYWLIILIAFALVFDFLNGFHDSANVVATIISSRTMSSRMALTMAALADFSGPFLFGVAVAKTIGHGIMIPESITIEVLIAALVSACIWNLVTWFFGIPSSSSHALIGGLIGAVLIGGGIKAIISKGIIKVTMALFFSPIIGLFFGWLVMKLTYHLLRKASPRANYFFKVGQIPTAIALAISHGANDAQKTMGVITLGLVITGYQQEFSVPLWVIVISASAISLGTFSGGWRLIKTLGSKFYKIKPIHSFTSQLASAMVIISASLFGGPVSTTQVVSMSIMGAGAGERLSKVRWLVLKEIFLSWVLTIPITAVLAIPIYLLIRLFTH
ncbi:MAG: inorganic phosphate transporter [Sphingobacteriales bacterium]|nr:inorganic phosphate transporter [Sphingobacteriales bacterium]